MGWPFSLYRSLPQMALKSCSACVHFDFRVSKYSRHQAIFQVTNAVTGAIFLAGVWEVESIGLPKHRSSARYLKGSVGCKHFSMTSQRGFEETYSMSASCACFLRHQSLV